MRKTKRFSLITFLLSALLLITVCAGCASSGKNTDNADKSKKIVHPRSYTINPYDSAKSLSLTYNKYNYCYENRVDMWSFLKKDKPLVEDKIRIKGSVKSNIKIPCLAIYLEDKSYDANYCTVLSDDNNIIDMDPGKYYDIDFQVVLKESTKGNLSIVFAYDGINHGMNSFLKIGKPAILTFGRLDDEEAVTTNTNEESVTEEVSAPEVFNIQLEKLVPFMEIETKYPFVNGVEDMSVVDNYQVVPDITFAFGDYLPKKGDTINITWTAYSDVRLKQIYVRPVDCSAAAGGWRELLNVDWDYLDRYVIAHSISPDTPFTGTLSFTLDRDVVSQLNLCIWYDIGDARPEGPAILKMAR